MIRNMQLLNVLLIVLIYFIVFLLVLLLLLLSFYLALCTIDWSCANYLLRKCKCTRLQYFDIVKSRIWRAVTEPPTVVHLISKRKKTKCKNYEHCIYRKNTCIVIQFNLFSAIHQCTILQTASATKNWINEIDLIACKCVLKCVKMWCVLFGFGYIFNYFFHYRSRFRWILLLTKRERWRRMRWQHNNIKNIINNQARCFSIASLQLI